MARSKASNDINARLARYKRYFEDGETRSEPLTEEEAANMQRYREYFDNLE